MSEPVTQAGRALLRMEDFNERSFPLIRPGAIAAIEAEAVARERERLAAAVRGLPTWDILGETVIELAAVLALIEGEP